MMRSALCQVLGPTKSASSRRVVSRATKRNIGNQEEREGEERECRCDRMRRRHPTTIAGARAPPALPKMYAKPIAVPRICVGNNSVALSAKLLAHEDALVAGLGPASRLFVAD